MRSLSILVVGPSQETLRGPIFSAAVHQASSYLGQRLRILPACLGRRCHAMLIEEGVTAALGGRGIVVGRMPKLQTCRPNTKVEVVKDALIDVARRVILTNVKAKR